MQMQSFDGQVVLRGARVTLRPLTQLDAGPIVEFAGDLNVSRFTRTIPYPFGLQDAQAFVARSIDVGRTIGDVWAMDGTASGLGSLVGVIGLAPMNSGRARQSEIGYWVAPALWNSGLASEGLNLLLEANPQKSQTIFAEVFQDNPGSARVLTNAGFEFVGDAESFSLARNLTIPTWTYLKTFG
ncbi:MAG: RimJ/RimL family protein N-acetyltransferase [Paracoccaceae bacterium]|jgi:RimJ/RimL family protein N-acetyltransferase